MNRDMVHEANGAGVTLMLVAKLFTVVLFPLAVVACTFPAGAYPFLGFAFAGAFVILAATSRRTELSWAIVLAVFIVVVRMPGSGSPLGGWALFSLVASSLGLGSVALSAFVCLRPAPPRRLIERLLRICALPLLVTLVPLVNFLSIPLNKAQDLVLYRLDLALGFSPSVLAGGLCATSPLLYHLCFCVYSMLPLMVGLVYAVQCRHGGAGFPLIGGMVVLSLLGSGLYEVMPATGPIYYFGDAFPFSIGAAAALNHLRGQHLHIPNAMPSLHAAWAYLLLWASSIRKSRIVWFTAPFVLLTLFSTIGLGEHYVIDLVVAAPLALCVFGVVSTRVAWRGERARAVCSGAAVTLAWFMLFRLRTGLPLALTWLLYSATVAVSFWDAAALGRKLDIEPETLIPPVGQVGLPSPASAKLGT